LNSFLLDTNILVYLANSAAPEYSASDAAVKHLLASNNILYIAPKNLVEFWSVATRKGPNGLSMSVQNASLRVTNYSASFPLLPDTSNLLDIWQTLCVTYQVEGPKCYDARLVAYMVTHGIDSILTTNIKHFVGYAGITPVDPSAL
jgi:predicted nucleic acid-binding protein